MKKNTTAKLIIGIILAYFLLGIDPIGKIMVGLCLVAIGVFLGYVSFSNFKKLHIIWGVIFFWITVGYFGALFVCIKEFVRI